MKYFIVAALLIAAIVSCQKEEPTQPSPPSAPTASYTPQYLTKSGANAASNGIYWVIDGDTLHLGQCQNSYTTGDYYESFSFQVGVEYDFQILRGIPPSMSSFEVKNQGTLKFIDGNSNTDAYGGESSLVITQGATWTYDIFYGQCGSITNQLQVIVP
ncbi:hypothetical protein [Wandonia haliotis]